MSYELKNGSQSAATCASCKQGIHAMCQYALDGFFDSVGECCCQHDFDLVIHAMSLEVERSARVREAFGELAPEEEDAATELAAITAEPAGKKRGDSGYIHPDAWPSSRDIGTFVGVANAQSTGYKRATKMYKGLYGNVCEWANLAAAGGGVVPIVGCMGNKATDLHHGPDKNTFNNAKASVGVGDSENVHLICSFCVSPETKILTSDLRWIRADEVTPEDELVGFDEQLGGQGAGRSPSLRRSGVKSVVRATKPGVRLVLSNGETLTTSADHKWVASSRSSNRLKWREASKLKPGYTLRKLLQPWGTDRSYEAGWLAGMYDGEGSMTRYHLNFGQKHGAELDEFRRILAGLISGRLNEQFRPAGSGSNLVSTLDWTALRLTNFSDIMSILGSIRPLRLLPRAGEFWEGKSATATSERVEVVSIEDVGDIEVISIETTTKTYIADGYLSHNCHNAWHGVNDEFYGPYDRSQDTPRPHVPTVPYAAHDGEMKADLATLVEIEEQRRKAGRNGRQRNPDLVELGIDDAYDEA